MNFKLFSLLAFVLAIFVFKSASAQMPQMPQMPGIPDMPKPPGMEEGMQAANMAKDMAMSQMPSGDSMNTE